MDIMALMKKSSGPDNFDDGSDIDNKDMKIKLLDDLVEKIMGMEDGEESSEMNEGSSLDPDAMNESEESEDDSMMMPDLNKDPKKGKF